MSISSTAIATRNGNGSPPTISTVESVIMRGDLSKLTDSQRLDYYHAVCKSVGLNPLTKPFEYITLNNKLTLYALRACTDQLRSIHRVSVSDVTENERDGVYIVTCKVSNADGRTDISKGAVSIANLKGEALANAIMKAETKAKRRATLSICGLGMLDETEVEDIPATRRQNPHVTRPEDVVDIPPDGVRTIPDGDTSIRVLPKTATRAEFERAQKEMYAITDDAALTAWADKNANRFQIFHPDYKSILRGLFAAHRESLRANPAATSAAAGPGIPPFLDRSAPPAAQDPEAVLKWIDEKLSSITAGEELEAYWNDRIAPRLDQMFPPDQEEALGLFRKHEARLAP